MSIVRVIVIALCIEIHVHVVAFLAGCFGDYCSIIYCGMMICMCISYFKTTKMFAFSGSKTLVDFLQIAMACLIGLALSLVPRRVSSKLKFPDIIG